MPSRSFASPRFFNTKRRNIKRKRLEILWTLNAILAKLFRVVVCWLDFLFSTKTISMHLKNAKTLKFVLYVIT